MIQKYINYLSSIRGYSVNTAIAYEKDLRAFVTWAKTALKDARWSAITRDDIDHYITHLEHEGLKPSTTNRKLSTISGLYHFFQREGLDVTNPCQYESRRKVANTLPNTIPTEDLKKAYKASYGVAKLLIGLLATTGMRLQETLNLRWDDIDLKTGEIKTHGKGMKDRKTFTTLEVIEVLHQVVQYYTPTGKIFSLDQRKARFLVWEALKPYSNAKQLSPHAIRHTVATNWATNGANVTTIAKMLGHEHIETTQKYIDMSAADIRQAAAKYNFIN